MFQNELIFQPLSAFFKKENYKPAFSTCSYNPLKAKSINQSSPSTAWVRLATLYPIYAARTGIQFLRDCVVAVIWVEACRQLFSLLSFEATRFLASSKRDNCWLIKLRLLQSWCCLMLSTSTLLPSLSLEVSMLSPSKQSGQSPGLPFSRKWIRTGSLELKSAEKMSRKVILLRYQSKQYRSGTFIMGQYGLNSCSSRSSSRSIDTFPSKQRTKPQSSWL